MTMAGSYFKRMVRPSICTSSQIYKNALQQLTDERLGIFRVVPKDVVSTGPQNALTQGAVVAVVDDLLADILPDRRFDVAASQHVPEFIFVGRHLISRAFQRGNMRQRPLPETFSTVVMLG